jgi:hypothetical protein
MDWPAAPEAGLIAAIFDQDVDNLQRLQEGLEFSKEGKFRFSLYQE